MPPRPKQPKAKRPGRLPPGVREVRPGYYQARIAQGGRRLSESGSDAEALGAWYAAQVRSRYRGQFDAAGYGRDREPLRQYMARWLLTRRGSVTERHWQNHVRQARLVCDYLGDLPLRAITAGTLRTLYGRLMAPPVSGAGGDPIGRSLAPKTVREVHGTIRLALQDAVRVERILERNEADYVQLPRRGPTRAQRVLDSAELAAFWRAADGHRLRALWYLASLFPSRSGELRALRWADVDEERAELVVRRSVERTGDAGRQLVTKAPKTAAGTRVVALDAELLALLRRHRAGQAAERLAAGAKWVDHGLVFATKWGTPLDAGNIRRMFRLLLRDAGVADPQGVRFHDLRHTGVSALLAAGVPDVEVAAIAGHANSTVTRTIYGHLMRRSRAVALGEARAFHARNVGDQGAAAGSGQSGAK